MHKLMSYFEGRDMMKTTSSLPATLPFISPTAPDFRRAQIRLSNLDHQSPKHGSDSVI